MYINTGCMGGGSGNFFGGKNIGNKSKMVHKGCTLKFATGLNIKIGIVQKVYEWSNCPFAKMIL